MQGRFLGVEPVPNVFAFMPFATETPLHCTADPVNTAVYYRALVLACPLCGDCTMIAPRLAGVISDRFVPEFARVCGRCHGFAIHAVIGPLTIQFAFRVGFGPQSIMSIPARSDRQPAYLPRIVSAMNATIRADTELMKFRTFFRTADFQFKLHSVPGIGWIDLLESNGMPRMAESMYYMMNYVPKDDVQGSLAPMFHIDRADLYRYRPLRIFEGPDIDT